MYRKNFIKVLILVFVMVCGYFFISLTTNAYTFSQSGMAYFISTQFGVDASKEATIHYQTEQENTYAMLTTKDDADFSKATKVEATTYRKINLLYPEVSPNKQLAILGFPAVSYEVDMRLTDLTPGTNYKYYITDGTNKSEVYEFMTAKGGNETFTFTYTTDPQQYGDPVSVENALKAGNNPGRWNEYNNWSNEIFELAGNLGLNVDFTISGGDLSEHGGDANYWNLMFSPDYLKKAAFVPVVGNHDFTPLVSSGGVDGRFFSTMFGTPYNGATESNAESFGEISYFFKYNDTLFVMMSCSYIGYETQGAWLEKVLKENPAQVKIVCCHYPANTDATDTMRDYIPILDKYAVDFYLYGHTHTYALQKNYIARKATNDSSLGTTYLSIGSPDGDSDIKNKCYFTVSKDFIGVKVYDENNASVIEFNQPVKRPPTSEITTYNEEEFAKTLKFDVNKTTFTSADLVWGNMAYGNIYKISLLNSEKAEIGSKYVSGTKISGINVSGLAQNSEYTYYALLEMYDGTTKEVEVKLDTTITSYGTLSNPVATKTSSGYRLTFKSAVRPEVKNFKLYLNETFVKDLSLDTVKINFTDDELIPNKANKVKLTGILDDGREVDIYEFILGEDAKTYKVTYYLDGGTCEGLVNEFTEKEDVTLLTPVKEGYTFLGWFDGETKVTAIDSIEKDYTLVAKWEKILAEFTITYDLDGGTASNLTNKFKENENVTLPTPTKSGFKFLGWFDGETKVETITNKDYTLKAKWEAEEPIIEPDPEPNPVEESGCNNTASILIFAVTLLGVAFIRRRKF